MRTLFEQGFQKEAWRPTLGLSLDDLLSTGADIYKTYEKQETAEEQRKAAEAAAAAAQAQAQATATAAAIRTQGKILGIPTNYLMIGGAGLAAIALIIALTKK